MECIMSSSHEFETYVALCAVEELLRNEILGELPCVGDIGISKQDLQHVKTATHAAEKALDIVESARRRLEEYNGA